MYLRISFVSLFIFLLHIQISAQVVWTVPAFPTKFDDVTVFYDASKGNGALEGHQGDVYAHTGVITSESANGNDWQHVIGNWGTADPRVLMTRVSDDLYSISYNITDFYIVPFQEEVFKMAFVFRNLSGSIVGRDTDGSDIFTDVYPSDLGLYLTLQSPQENDVFVYEDDSLYIDAVASDTANIDVFDNDVLIYSTFSDRAAFFYHPSSTGNHLLKFVATTDSTATLEKEIFVLKRNAPKINPPAGLVNGINYYSDSTYIFQLYAPLKDFVFLLSPANSYRPRDSFQMNLAEDGKTFWIELPRSTFTQGKNTYQYLIDGGIRIADPHSEVVLDPAHDAWIDNRVMETLPDYPLGLTQGIVTAFDTTYIPFFFEVMDFEKPEKTKLVIYELLIRDFLADHSYPSLIDTLDYLEKLGVNAIELMPVSEFEGNISWGYNQSFHMAMDKYYGTRKELKQFVDAAHQRGIAVIMDVVFNHTFGQGPLAQMYWDATNSRPSAESPYLNVVARHPFNVGYDFNHESIATKIWVKRILSYWITEFKVDGFRFDLSKGLTQFNSGNNADLMAQYDASRIAILKDYADHIWSLDSTSYVIMEHFANNDEEIVLSDYGMMLWGNMNYQFNQAAKGFQSDLEWADYSFRQWNKPHLIPYMESHDEERLMYRLYHEGASQGGYDTRVPATAMERVAAASTIFYSLPGPKMIWMFGELGYDYSINTCTNGTVANECRLDPKPIRWDYLQDANREKLRRVTNALIHLRKNYPTFSTEDYVFSDGNFYLKTVHLNHPDMDALTLVNFRIINSDINPKFQYTGTWYEYFSGDSLEVTDTEAKITFGPGEYRIYTSERITPPGGFITATTDIETVEIGLYPSLVAGDEYVYSYLPGANYVVGITVTDVHGIQSALPFEESGDGRIKVQVSKNIPAGLYVMQFLTRDKMFAGKFVKQ